MLGMQTTMLCMHLPLIITILVLLPLKETGPAAKKKLDKPRQTVA
jgi:hypothetical protein